MNSRFELMSEPAEQQRRLAVIGTLGDAWCSRKVRPSQVWSLVGMKDDNEDGSPIGAPAHASAVPPTKVSTTDQVPGAPTSESAEADDQIPLRPVSADMQQFIGRQLRAVFDDVARQPVPDRFLELMKQLDSKTGLR